MVKFLYPVKTSKNLKVRLLPSKKKYVTYFIESPLKVMKNDYYFILKAIFVLKIFKFLSWLFDHYQKTAWLKDKVNFKIYDVITWWANNWNTYITQYLTKKRQQDKETWSNNRIYHEKYSSSNITKKMRQKA